MCGIIGLINKNSLSAIDTNKLIKKIAHRGPDDNGIFNEKNTNSCIQLLHTRLSIRSIGYEGKQPYQYLSHTLIFNGEIYNTDYLSKKLRSINIGINSNCDTEILCKFIFHFGIDSISEIRGMYAFCIYDSTNKKFIAVRDPLGIKPLFYNYNSNNIIFSSESSVFENRGINIKSFESYMIFGYFPNDGCLLSEVKKMLPGEIHVIDTESFSVNRFFFEKEYKEFMNKNICNLEIEELLGSSINEQLISDVPVGLFLSGGIDSSLIAHHASKKIPNISCYVSEYFGPQSERFNSDLRYASKLSKEFNLKLIKVPINPQNKRFSDEFINWASNLDQPQANITGFTSYLLFKKAKLDGTKVILTGDGADEIFGGYSRYHLALFLERYKFLRFTPKFSQYYSTNKLLMYARATGLTDFKLLKKICNLKFNDFKTTNFLETDFNIAEEINRLDLTCWLSEESNMRIDRASMLNSIEARVPFQDIRIVKKYFQIPIREKFKYLNKDFSYSYPKKQLREYASKILPKEFIIRRKIGWDCPDSKWFRSGLNEILNYYVNDYDSGFFDKKESRKIYKSHFNKTQYNRSLLRRILMFNIWHEKINANK